MEKLNIDEVAKHFGVSRVAVEGLIESGALPAVRSDGEWHIEKEMLEDWVRAEAVKLRPEEFAAIEVIQERKSLCVSSLLQNKNIIVDLFATTKSEVIQKLVDRMVSSYRIAGKKALLDAVRKREMLCSTAVLKGVAFPHPRRVPKQRFKAPRIVVGISGGGIDFEAEDGDLTHVFVLFCAPRDDLHLKMLAKFGRLLGDYRLVLRIRRAETPEEAIRIFREAETEDAEARNLKLVDKFS